MTRSVIPMRGTFLVSKDNSKVEDKTDSAMNSRICTSIGTYAAFSLLLNLPLVAFAAEPAWWTQQKAECGLSPSLAYNTWVAQGMPCNGGGDQTPSLDPRQIAVQNAIPRYNALVHSLADRYYLLDKQSWLNVPLGTEAEFFNSANQMHKFLVNEADANRFREGQLREELAGLEEVIETYPGLIANLRTDSETMRLERNRLAVALEAAKQQLGLTQRAAKQLETRAYRYEEDVKRDKATVLSWLTVLLPTGMVETVSPNPYESIFEPLVGSVPVHQGAPEAAEAPKPVEAIALRPSRFGVRIEINPEPLAGTAENAVAQLEADAAAFRTARHDQNSLRDYVSTVRPIAAQLQQERSNALDQRGRLEGEIRTFGGQLKVTTWALLLARDALESAKETFLYRAADAWIWQNAKTEAIRQVKNEVRRLVAARSTGVSYRDITDGEMHAFINAGKQNIFSLGERALSSGDRLYQVLNRFQTLRTHTLGYVEESFRVASQGSPREMIEFVGGMSEGIDNDAEQLVKANLGAIRIPEPWKSIYAKYFLKRPE